MEMRHGVKTGIVAAVLAGLLAGNTMLANGGPFVIKYPTGDPAAKGVLAKIDPNLKPARETQLKVVKEDLTITFGKTQPGWHYTAKNSVDTAPLVHVEAKYTIKNPLNKEVNVDFGFPILRGIYMSPWSMMPQPDVRVKVDEKHVRADIISNSAIYGIIRNRARATVEAEIKKDKALAGLVKTVRRKGPKHTASRTALQEHLTGELAWGGRDAALLVEYAGLDLGDMSKKGIYPADRSHFWLRDPELNKLINENLGTLAAIGEKKATQMLALLAGKFDPKVASGYEEIFTAWGGDVRERSVDLESGKLRPREVVVTKGKRDMAAASLGDTLADPTIYARVDYLEDSNSKLTALEKASCKRILKNLPVIFTFAPMNLLHYQVRFAPKAEQVVTVSYSQYAYKDTKGRDSYQLAYVVHPASMWDEFGPINLKIKTPPGTRMVSSAPCKKTTEAEAMMVVDGFSMNYDCYIGQVKDKTGELFIGIDAEGWKEAAARAVAAIKKKSN